MGASVCDFLKCGRPCLKAWNGLPASVSPSTGLWFLWVGAVPGCHAEEDIEEEKVS